MKETFGQYVRMRREELRVSSREFTVRKVAAKLGVQPSYLSKVERAEMPPPSAATITKLAAVLGEDPDLLLAMAGKMPDDLRQVILGRPRLFADLIRQLKDAPDHAVLRVVREVRDGTW